MLKGYQPGNFIFLKNGEPLKILEIHEDQFKVEDINGLKFNIASSQVLPIKITENVLKKFGFILKSEKKEILHFLKIYHININNKIYYLRGYVYLDKSIWVFNNITIIYLNQLQNLLNVLEPRFDLLFENNVYY